MKTKELIIGILIFILAGAIISLSYYLKYIPPISIFLLFPGCILFIVGAVKIFRSLEL